MGNVDVVIPVYKPDKKLQMVISRLMGQTIVPSKYISDSYPQQ